MNFFRRFQNSDTDSKKIVSNSSPNSLLTPACAYASISTLPQRLAYINANGMPQLWSELSNYIRKKPRECWPNNVLPSPSICEHLGITPEHYDNMIRVMCDSLPLLNPIPKVNLQSFWQLQRLLFLILLGHSDGAEFDELKEVCAEIDKRIPLIRNRDLVNDLFSDLLNLHDVDQFAIYLAMAQSILISNGDTLLLARFVHFYCLNVETLNQSSSNTAKPRRRGRPPGSKNKTSSSGKKRKTVTLNMDSVVDECLDSNSNGVVHLGPLLCPASTQQEDTSAGQQTCDALLQMLLALNNDMQSNTTTNVCEGPQVCTTFEEDDCSSRRKRKLCNVSSSASSSPDYSPEKTDDDNSVLPMLPCKKPKTDKEMTLVEQDEQVLESPAGSIKIVESEACCGQSELQLQHQFDLANHKLETISALLSDSNVLESKSAPFLSSLMSQIKGVISM